MNDCWFDLTFGIDWIRLFGTRNTQKEIESTVRSTILSSYGVVEIKDLSVATDSSTRAMTVTGTIKTIFSEGYDFSAEVNV